MIDKTLPRTEQTKPWAQYSKAEVRAFTDAREKEIVRDAGIDPSSPGDYTALIQILARLIVDRSTGLEHLVKIHNQAAELIVLNITLEITKRQLDHE